MKIIIRITVIASLGLLTGCASIMHGTHQDLSFQSNPDGATVTVGGRVIGRTPITTSLKKESGQVLEFSKDGYKTISMRLDTSLDGWFWGNIVLGGLIGSTTDGLSGAVNQYSPSQYMVTLQPTGSTAFEGKTSLSDQQKTKDFVVTGYRDIVADLHKGGGQYLTSLLELLKVPADKKDEAIKRMRALSDAYPNIAEFADHVADLGRDYAPKSAPNTAPLPLAPPSKSLNTMDGVL